MKRIKTWVILIIFVSTFAGGLIVGKGVGSKVLAENDQVFEDLKVFTEVLSIIEKNYVEDVKTKDLIYDAIKGMLQPLDPHSGFMPPEAYKEAQVDTKGEFGGIGIQIGLKDNKLKVIAPIEDTPAERIGIKAGDVIIKVNDDSTKEMSLTDAVQKMRGPKGTKVSLTISREGTPDPIVFDIIRESIRIKSIKSRMLVDNIGYIRITQFQEQTSNDLKKAMKKLKDEKMSSLIIDLRNNPGGLLNSAVEVSEEFLESGKVVVSIKGRNQKKDDFLSTNKEPEIGYPIIVLVNEGSASASEIVSGALQDWGRAVILGEQTFGKGSVQTVIPLTDGSGLRLTTAKYYTPKDRSIQNVGISPDIVVKNVPAEESKVARKFLREKDLERHIKNDKIDEENLPSEKKPEPVIEKDSIEEKDKEKNKDKDGDKEKDGEIDQEKKDEEDVQLKKAIDLIKAWGIFKGIESQQKDKDIQSWINR